MEPFVVLVPLRGTKPYIDVFKDIHLNRIEYEEEPLEKIVAVDKEGSHHLEDDENFDEWTIVKIEHEEGIGSIPRITHAREMLRQTFMETEGEWALWLDSDVYPEEPCKLVEKASDEEIINLVQKYPGRSGNYECTGGGMFVCHRDGMREGRFNGFGLDPEFLSEDYAFWAPFMLLDRHDRTGRKSDWRTGRKICDIMDVEHIVEKEEYLDDY